jgi:hypothetical protein
LCRREKKLAVIFRYAQKRGRGVCNKPEVSAVRSEIKNTWRNKGRKEGKRKKKKMRQETEFVLFCFVLFVEILPKSVRTFEFHRGRYYTAKLYVVSEETVC